MIGPDPRFVLSLDVEDYGLADHPVVRIDLETDEAVAMSALKRETATGLLQLIATKLADRWRQASPIDSLPGDGLPVDALGPPDV